MTSVFTKWYPVALLVAVSAVGFAATARADIQIVKQKALGKTKISPTVTEYRFQVTARNNGAAATDVTATVTSYTDQITVISGTLQFPDMAAGETAISTNEFVIQKPKKYKFSKPKALKPNGPMLRIDFSATSIPVANAGVDQVRGVGALALLNGRNSYDPFGKPLTYLWTLQSAPMGSAATLSDSSSVLARFTPDVAGDYVFNLVVSNGTNASAPSSTTVSTNATRPVADAGVLQVVKKKSTVVLDGSASTNPMERPLTYLWQILSRPEDSKAALSDATALRPTFLADKKGSYRIQLIVSDGPLSSAPSIVTVTRGTKRTNSPPLANAGFDISSYGATLPVILQGGRSTDLDGDFLTYRWFVLGRPAGSVAAPPLNDPHPIFPLDGAGAWHLQVNVSDGQSESISTVLINTDNDVAPPSGGYLVPNNSNPADIVVDGEYRSNYRDLNGEQGNLARSWTLLSRPAGSAAVVGSGTPSCSNDGIGTGLCSDLQTDMDGDYAVQLKSTDNGSLASFQSLGIARGAARPVAVVDSSSWAPWKGSAIHFVDWVPGLDVTIDGGQSFDLNGLPLTYHWTLLHRPAGSEAVLNDPTVAAPTITLDVDGNYVAQLIVNNGGMDSLPVTTTLVNYANHAPIAMDLLVDGPWQSPCIPVLLRGSDSESCPSSFSPGVVFRRINSTTNGVLIDFLSADLEGTSTLCYRPRRFFTGLDQFSYEAFDAGFPWMCGDDAPDCRSSKTSSPAFGNINVFEIP